MARERLTWGPPFSATWEAARQETPLPEVAPPEPQPAEPVWEDGVPPEARAAWQAGTAEATGVAWDAWSREKKESRPAAVPVAITAVLVAAVIAALTASPTPIVGQPVGQPVAQAAPERPAPTTTSTPAPAPAPAATTTTVRPPPPAPKQEEPPPQQPQPPPQSPGTVRLARGGTATLVRKDVVNGVLPVPDGVREATWWGSPFDGQTGATVLAGHVNWKGATGPFAELWNARLGDAVTVVDDQGRTYAYVISQLVTVHKNDLPSRAQELFGQDGAHRLVLVTCGGRWVGGRDGYEENRVVIAGPAG